MTAKKKLLQNIAQTLDEFIVVVLLLSSGRRSGRSEGFVSVRVRKDAVPFESGDERGGNLFRFRCLGELGMVWVEGVLIGGGGLDAVRVAKPCEPCASVELLPFLADGSGDKAGGLPLQVSELGSGSQDGAGMDAGLMSTTISNSFRDTAGAGADGFGWKIRGGGCRWEGVIFGDGWGWKRVSIRPEREWHHTHPSNHGGWR